MLLAQISMYLIACFVNFPSFFINVQFLFKVNATTPPVMAPINVASMYQIFNSLNNSINIKKSDAVATIATMLYFKNEFNIFKFYMILK